METDGFPAISLNFGEILYNLPSADEALFRALIAAKDSPFPASFYPSSREPAFYAKFGQTPTSISSKRRSHFGDRWIPHDFPKIPGEMTDNMSPSGETLFRTIVSAKDAPFSASF